MNGDEGKNVTTIRDEEFEEVALVFLSTFKHKQWGVGTSKIHQALRDGMRRHWELEMILSGITQHQFVAVVDKQNKKGLIY